MANVFLVGVEPRIAAQIRRALAKGPHRIEQCAQDFEARLLKEADVVFAGGKTHEYLPLLRRVRLEKPTLPFVVVTRVPETNEWLDAIEAGATDYCSAPFESRQLRWLMESVLPKHRHAAAGGKQD